MRVVAMLPLILLSGCASGETVYLQMSGREVKCGPYSSTVVAESRIVAQEQLRDCIADFQRQGYERRP